MQQYDKLLPSTIIHTQKYDLTKRLEKSILQLHQSRNLCNITFNKNDWPLATNLV